MKDIMRKWKRWITRNWKGTHRNVAELRMNEEREIRRRNCVKHKKTPEERKQE